MPSSPFWLVLLACLFLRLRECESRRVGAPSKKHFFHTLPSFRKPSFSSTPPPASISHKTHNVRLPSLARLSAYTESLRRRGVDLLDDRCTPIVVSDRYWFVWLRNVGKNGGTGVYGGYLQPSLCAMYMKNVRRGQERSFPCILNLYNFFRKFLEFMYIFFQFFMFSFTFGLSLVIQGD